MDKIGIIGIGTVGSAICKLAEKKYKVLKYDINQKYLKNMSDTFESKILFITVPTNCNILGYCDLENIINIFDLLCEYKWDGLVAICSTIVIGTTKKLSETYKLNIVYIPIFGKEINIYEHLLDHDNIIIGSYNSNIINDTNGEHLKNIFGKNKTYDIMSPMEVEIIKYFCNVIRTMKIIFANNMYELCISNNVSYENILAKSSEICKIPKDYLICNDTIRGPGGKCLLKDTITFCKHIETNLDIGKNMELFRAIINDSQLYQYTVPSNMPYMNNIENILMDKSIFYYTISNIPINNKKLILYIVNPKIAKNTIIEKYLLSSAKESLERKTLSILHKEIMPPSKNMHDYISHHPYIHYINNQWVKIDEKHNEESEFDNLKSYKYDKPAFMTMLRDVVILTIAYKLTNKYEYIEKAIDNLKIWFINDETKMTPNLYYAQYGNCVYKDNDGLNYDCIDSTMFYYFIDIVKICIPLMDDDSKNKLYDWFGDFLDYLIKIDRYYYKNKMTKNNRLLSLILQLIMLSIFLKNATILKRGIDLFILSINDFIDEEYNLKHELKRKNNLHYVMYTLSFLTNICTIINRLNINIDPWNLFDCKIKKCVLKYIAYFKDKWPYKNEHCDASQNNKNRFIIPILHLLEYDKTILDIENIYDLCVDNFEFHIHDGIPILYQFTLTICENGILDG